MRWLKRDLWKAGITIVGILLLLMLMVWVPVSAASVHEEASGSAPLGTVMVQATPTEDATVTVLNKEKLAQEVKQLKDQNELDLFGWLRTNASILLSTLVVVIGGLIGLFRWLADRQDEQERRREDQRSEQGKRAEERFQAAVTGLGDDKEGAKIGAAILLRTFLRPGYEQFYAQTFDLAVANLRLPRTPNPPEDPDTPLPLSQALIVAFKEAFPRARDMLKKQDAQFRPESLDARGIRLDNAYLAKADLKQVFMQRASLRKVDLRMADLSGANLIRADLSDANLSDANLSGAYLGATNLSRVTLNMADLSGAYLTEADLTEANLTEADLSGAHLGSVKLIRTDLGGADVSEANLEDAVSLEGTNLRGVTGLTKEQLGICKAKGAIVDEDPTTSSSQSTVSPLPPSQSDDTQASSAPSAQGSLTPDTSERSAASSKLGPES